MVDSVEVQEVWEGGVEDGNARANAPQFTPASAVSTNDRHTRSSALTRASRPIGAQLELIRAAKSTFFLRLAYHPSPTSTTKQHLTPPHVQVPTQRCATSTVRRPSRSPRTVRVPISARCASRTWRGKEGRRDPRSTTTIDKSGGSVQAGIGGEGGAVDAGRTRKTWSLGGRWIARWPSY